MKRCLSKQVLVGSAILSLVALGVVVASLPLYGHQTEFDLKGVVQRLALIEERDPFRLRDLARNGQPTLIAFIDHLCYTCLRSVEDVEQLKKEFSGRANIVVIDPSHITTAHSWAKDHYQVWFVPKFIILNNGGNVATEYFGQTSPRVLASDLQTLLAQ